MIDVEKIIDCNYLDSDIPTGVKVWYADSLVHLAKRVENNILPGILVKVSKDNPNYPFGIRTEHTPEVIVNYRYIYFCDNKISVDTPPSLSENKEKDACKYKPFSSKDEFISYASRIGVVWIKHKTTKDMFMVTGYCENGIIADEFIPFDDLFEYYTFLDKSPCGVEIC